MPRHALLGTIVALLLLPLRLVAEDDNARKPQWREQATHHVHGRRCKAVSFSPDGRWLATAGGGGKSDVKLWDVQSGDEIASWEAHPEETRSVVFSPNGQLLATGGGIWNGPGGVAL